MTNFSISRRRMLAAFAAAGGASRLGPFLPAAVHAAVAPKRILTIFSPMGYLESSFWPTGTGSDFSLGATQTALSPWKNKLLYLDGVGIYGTQYWFPKDVQDGNEHGNGYNMVFTGCKSQGGATGPSVDQVIADYQYGQAKTQYRSLALGVTESQGCFYSKAKTPTIGQTNPKAAYDLLFKNFNGPTLPAGTVPGNVGGTGTQAPIDTSAVDRSRKQKLAVLNVARADVGRIRGLAGREDQKKLDAHLDGLSSLENRLKTMGGSGMVSPVTPKTPSSPPAPPGSAGEGCAKPALISGESLDNAVHSQMDIITAAFACDLTRSASLIMAHHNGMDVFPDVGQHDTTHAISTKQPNPTVLENHRKYDRWFASQWAYLFGRLDSIKEGNGTLLDNTLIIFGSDTTTLDNPNWNEQGAHNMVRFPLWMAGGGNFAFKTGQAIKLPSPPNRPGSAADCAKWVTQNQVYTSVCQAFGMDVNKFGDLDQGKGPVAQLQRV